MSVHPLGQFDRNLLPRSLIQRFIPELYALRRPAVGTYEFRYEIGQTVVLDCTGELVTVIGRHQFADCVDEYDVAVIGVDAEPLRVLEHQIRLRRGRRRVYRVRYRFRVGQTVRYSGSDMRMRVVGRYCSARGIHQYHVDVIDEDCGNRHRTIMGSHLEPDTTH